MARMLQSLGAAGLGAGLMYLLDRDRGRRRRAFLRDQLTHGSHLFRQEFGRATRDLRNRARGVTATARTSLQVNHPGDEVLAERVKSRIGRGTTHPGAIEIQARDGRISLRGPILANQLGDLLSAVQSTPGIQEVENRLDIHEQPDVPALQSPGPPGRARNSADRVVWKPANRLLSGLAAGGLLVYGTGRGGFLGAAAKLAGIGIVVRATSNHTLGSIVGLDGRCEVTIQKTITVHAPIETVFLFLSNYSNFPRFMSHVEEVRDLGNNRSHWVAAGPGGIPIEWDARTTKVIKNTALAWASEPDSAIEHTGKMGFEAKDDNTTRITIHMSYKPPAGLLGHTVASILGVDPKHQIDEDFVRLKSLIELGKTRAHGKLVTREEIENLFASAGAGH